MLIPTSVIICLKTDGRQTLEDTEKVKIDTEQSRNVDKEFQKDEESAKVPGKKSVRRAHQVWVMRVSIG